jgi:hypothetical protein
MAGEGPLENRELKRMDWAQGARNRPWPLGLWRSEMEADTAGHPHPRRPDGPPREAMASNFWLGQRPSGFLSIPDVVGRLERMRPAKDNPQLIFK